MLRSLYSGVSGMRSFQTKMDVISNNIANANTTGFKSSSVRFQDMLSQTTANAQAPNAAGLGGINAQQIGLGVRVGSIDTNMVGGSLQSTNRDLDFGIQGEGFFVVSSDGGTTLNYTRDGAFYKDTSGNLVNSAGQRIMGYTGTAIDMDANPDSDHLPTNPNAATALEALVIEDTLTVGGTDYELQTFTIDGAGNVVGVYSDGTESTRFLIGQVALSSFSNPAGLEKVGGNNYIVSNNSGDPNFNVAGTPGKGVIEQGYLEMSNVDMAFEFTEMIVASRAYSANARSITTSDEMLQELINLKR